MNSLVATFAIGVRKMTRVPVNFFVASREHFTWLLVTCSLVKIGLCLRLNGWPYIIANEESWLDKGKRGTRG